jgi:hypothetical protein
VELETHNIAVVEKLHRHILHPSGCRRSKRDDCPGTIVNIKPVKVSNEKENALFNLTSHLFFLRRQACMMTHLALVSKILQSGKENTEGNIPSKPAYVVSWLVAAPADRWSWVREEERIGQDRVVLPSSGISSGMLLPGRVAWKYEDGQRKRKRKERKKEPVVELLLRGRRQLRKMISRRSGPHPRTHTMPLFPSHEPQRRVHAMKEC